MDENTVMWDFDCYSQEYMESMDEEEPELTGFMRGYLDY